jgi:hypothetical protein
MKGTEIYWFNYNEKLKLKVLAFRQQRNLNYQLKDGHVFRLATVANQLMPWVPTTEHYDDSL